MLTIIVMIFVFQYKLKIFVTICDLFSILFQAMLVPQLLVAESNLLMFQKWITSLVMEKER